ncbi:GNAT family N-acetyltransferase [Knoellia locipacati]|nr:GNAT family N-acetyltransferase [Knoellia locipacati]
MPTSTRVVSDLAVLEDDWRRLEGSTRALTAFQTWEWVQAWWQTLGRRRPVQVVSVHRDGEVVAMTALHPTRLGVGPASFELLTPLGQDHADEGLLVLGDAREHGSALLDALGPLVEGGRRGVNVPRLRESGDDHALVTGHPWRQRVRVSQEGRSTCPVLDLGALADPERELAARAKKCDVPRLRRRLAERGEVRIDLHRPVDPGFDELLRVYDLRWAERAGEQGLLSNGPARAFARDAVTALAARGDAWLSTLHLDDEPIAACLGYHVGETYYYHKPAFDPAHAKFGPGHILLSEVATACLGSGVRVLNFGRGTDAYKARWATGAHDVVSCSLTPARMPASVSSRLRHAAMALRVREHRGRSVPS